MKLLLIIFAVSTFFYGCQNKPSNRYQGYAEGEFVNISSSQSGHLDKLYVKRGMNVQNGSRLFALECDSEILALHQAKSELSAAQATLYDYEKGARPNELNIIEAQLTQAVANAEFAHKQFIRDKGLLPSNAISKAQFDDSDARAKSAAAKVKELTEALSVAKLSKRSDQIEAQRSLIKQKEYAMRQIEWKIDEKALKSKNNALVFDTLYEEGEFVPQGGIIIRLLPPENIKIRFFVPQAVAERLHLNQQTTIISRSDGKKIPAKITYISTEAEYTPPVIYSNETKEKLTYMVEAYPSATDALLLHPGQPVEVTVDD